LRALALALALVSLPLAYAEGPWWFWGVQNGAGGPVYFGVEADLRGERKPFSFDLAGRLRLGPATLWDGSATLAYRVPGTAELRLGYAAWFGGAPLDGRRLGAGLAYSLGASWTLQAAGTWPDRAYGAGLAWASGGFEGELWAMSTAAQASLSWQQGAWRARAWYRGAYPDGALVRAGAELGWREGVYALDAGWRSDLGVFARVGRQSPGWRAAVGGRWNPGRSAQLDARLAVLLERGIELEARAGYVFLPFRAMQAGLELRIDAYAAPSAQGE